MAALSFWREKERAEHQQDDDHELRDHPCAHELLAEIAIAAAKHVPQAHGQNDNDRAERQNNKYAES